MINRETFHKDPSKNPIINDGVADFADDRVAQNVKMSVSRPPAYAQ